MTLAAADPEADYIVAVADEFARLLGRDRLPTPGDYRQARDWWDAEVPLAIIVEEMETAIRRKRKGSLPPPSNLRYFAPAVREHWRNVQEMQAPGRRG